MFITAWLLQDYNACPGQVRLFAETFPDGVEATEELCERYALQFDFYWAAESLLTVGERDKYFVQLKPFDAAHRARRKVIADAYDAQYEAIAKAYQIELKPFDDVYWARRRVLEDAYWARHVAIKDTHTVELAKLFARVSST